MVSKRSHILSAIVLIVVLTAVIGKRIQATERSLIFTGQAQITGSLLLELNASPAVSTPGDTITLDISLTNQTKLTHSPEITLQIPPSLSLAQTTFASGVTFNLQTNELHWLPIASANGDTLTLSLNFHAETADIAQPEQNIVAHLHNDGDTKSTALTLWLGIPPQIRSVSSLSQISVGQPVLLTADVTGPGPITQHWDLGDGRRVDVTNPEIVYPAAGLYKINLEAANPLTAVSQSTTISVVPHPAAQFIINDSNPGLDQTVSFINQSGGQPPLIYNWDFGDGTTSTDPNPTHQYSTPGLYQIHLQVSNQHGQSDAFWTIQAGNTPIADMLAPESAVVGESIIGQAFGDETVTIFRWDMGDGRYQEGEQITHVYQREGEFYILVQAINDYGTTEIGRWINIGPGQLATYLPFIARAEILTSEPVETVNDGSTLVLEDVALDEPFVLEPVANLPTTTPPAEQLLFYINEARQQFDLPPLSYIYELSVIAQQHTDDMAIYHYTAHIGSDGSSPPERFLQLGYPNGYAGEATAWGFPNAYEAVEFWINSPAHRRIILNRFATDVGAGFTADASAPNVWYWTAEFGNTHGSAEAPLLQLQSPFPYVAPADEEEVVQETLITDVVNYRWRWPYELNSNQQFVLYLVGSNGTVQLGTVQQATVGIRYDLAIPAYDTISVPGIYNWQIQLETTSGSVIAQSPHRAINFAADPNLLPTPTPVVTPTATATPEPTLTPTSTPIALPTATLLPPPPTLPPIVVPTAEPTP